MAIAKIAIVFLIFVVFKIERINCLVDGIGNQVIQRTRDTEDHRLIGENRGDFERIEKELSSELTQSKYKKSIFASP